MTHAGFRADGNVSLDYGAAAKTPKLLTNLSAASMAGAFLWTASDEGRTIECLEPDGSGFRLKEQFSLDTLFSDLPGDKTDEVDIESIDISGDQLWICGSHCNVRRKPSAQDRLATEFRVRKSRHLIGAVKLTSDGRSIVKAVQALPCTGSESLRERLRANAYLAPYIDLPSKDNGLDIEGICVFDGSVFLGLRGPVLDSIAVIVELKMSGKAAIAASKPITHFVNLDGMGVRELTRYKDGMIVTAGPVNNANGPFRLHFWKPQAPETVTKPDAFCEWPESKERPEGLCLVEQHHVPGLLVLYDSPDEARITASRYRADWLSLKAKPMG